MEPRDALQLARHVVQARQQSSPASSTCCRRTKLQEIESRWCSLRACHARAALRGSGRVSFPVRSECVSGLPFLPQECPNLRFCGLMTIGMPVCRRSVAPRVSLSYAEESRLLPRRALAKHALSPYTAT